MTKFGRVLVLAIAGALAGSVLTVATQARPAVAASGVDCNVASTARPACYLAESVRMPLSASVSVTSLPADNATVSWTASCERGGVGVSTTGTTTAMTPFQAKINLPRTNGADCSLTANVSVNGQASMTAGFTYTTGLMVKIEIPQGQTPSGQPIYALRCLTDPGNNPAIRTPAVIRDCENLYSQAWTVRNGELIHGRYCLTDKGNGGSGSRLILYTCTGATDQIWTYRPRSAVAPDGAFVVKTHGGKLCLNDPKTSVANGTQLTISTCNGSNAQVWYTG